MCYPRVISGLYALGITAYQLVTGTVPFRATTPVAVAFMQVHEPLPLPSQRNPALSPAVEQVLLKALAKAPHDRYPQCAAFVQALAAAAVTPSQDAAAAVSASPPTVVLRRPAATLPPTAGLPSVGRRSARRRTAVIIAGGLLVVLVSALGVGVATHRPAGHAVTRLGGLVSTDWPLLRSGSAGDTVTALQYLLQAHGSDLTVDGTFGPQTDQSVRSFQDRQGLAVDGSVGPPTWQALLVLVQSGSTGPAVQTVQSLLTARGQTVTVDGGFNPQTGAAVRSFQQNHGLAVDGIVGPQSSVLFTRLALPAVPAPSEHTGGSDYPGRRRLARLAASAARRATAGRCATRGRRRQGTGSCPRACRSATNVVIWAWQSSQRDSCRNGHRSARRGRTPTPQ